MLINLPNLDELSFLNVLAFPNDSKTGLVSKICCSIVFLSISSLFSISKSFRSDNYFNILLHASVLPAPLSPDIIIA